ncbi:hypothetical protein GJAV_G00140860 [Gymnothorax javanicus]|nr:hypothetical protein GJAV_G00140860 [Gymnothorax javanicus]
MELKMGYRSQDRVRLVAGAVPSVHPVPPADATSVCCSGRDNVQTGRRTAARRKREIPTELHFCTPLSSSTSLSLEESLATAESAWIRETAESCPYIHL